MIYRIFRSYSPFLIILLPVLGILLWLQAFSIPANPRFAFDTYQMPFYKYIDSLLNNTPVWGKVLSLGLIIIQAILLIQINKKYLIIKERTYLPAFFFILLSSSYVELQRLNPAIIAGFFLIFAIEKVFSTYKYTRISYNYFDVGLILSLGSLFYAPLGYFILFVWISLAILRPFHSREWLFPILGFIIPYLLLFAYTYVFHNSHFYYLDYIKTVLKHAAPDFPYMNIAYYIFFGFLLFITIISSFYLTSTYHTKKIQNRKYFAIFLWLFIISVGIFLIDSSASMEILILIAIPLSFNLSDYFASNRSIIWGEFVFYILILLTIFNQLVAHQIISF
jgi:hypothetical protein